MAAGGPVGGPVGGWVGGWAGEGEGGRPVRPRSDSDSDADSDPSARYGPVPEAARPGAAPNGLF